jgi:endonuclease YncB( thermonuclease family)
MSIMGAGCRSVLAGELVVLLGLPAAATDVVRPEVEIIGVVSVIDGDTLEIHDRRIRLDGIDAPSPPRSAFGTVGRSGVGRHRRCSWPI